MGDNNTKRMSNKELLDEAFTRFPKAKRIAVENFTNFGRGKWDMAAALNLAADARVYKWDSSTCKAIYWVMKQNTY